MHIIVANAPKWSMNLHRVHRLKNLSGTPAALVPQFVGFSCSYWLTSYSIIQQLQRDSNHKQLLLGSVLVRLRLVFHFQRLWPDTSFHCMFPDEVACVPFCVLHCSSFMLVCEGMTWVSRPEQLCVNSLLTVPSVVYLNFLL